MALRKKINKADMFYMEHHALTDTVEEISKTIELDVKSVNAYYDEAKRIAELRKESEASGKKGFNPRLPFTDSDKGVTMMTKSASELADKLHENRPPMTAEQQQGVWKG